MTLTKRQIKILADAIQQTRDEELDCDEFMVHLAAWGERVLQGQSIDDASKSVKHHLQICPECEEEFRVLKEVLSEAGNSILDES